MWDTEMVLLLRYVIDDSEEPYKYTDDRLMKLLLTAAQFTQVENSFAQEYTISIENLTLRPDPTSTRNNTREDAFINLTILKAACLLGRGGLSKTNRGNIMVREGPYQFDGRGKMAGGQIVAQSWCQAYADAQYEFGVNSREPGMAIIGPYRSLLAAAIDPRIWRE